jgi:hypothetical protein
MQGRRNGRRFALLIGCAALAWTIIPASASAAPPPNDDFADAAVVGPGLPVVVEGTNAEATVEPGEPNHTPVPENPPAESSVWYRWTPSANVTAVLDLCDAESDGVVDFNAAVYTGTALNNLSFAPDTTGDPAGASGGGCSVRFPATAGTEYSIAVDFGASEGVATFTFRLRQFAPPANDDYANARSVGPALPIEGEQATTIDAGSEANEPSLLGGADNSRSVWFEWTPAAGGNVRIDVCDFDPRSGAGNVAIGVYTDGDSSLPVGTTVDESINCQLTFNAAAGTEYRIGVSGQVRGEGGFTLGIRSATPPGNDDFEAAGPLGPALPILAEGQNRFATVQDGEPEHGGVGGPERSVWYTWTPAASGPVAINACLGDSNGDLEPKLGVYTGEALNALTPVGSHAGGSLPYCYKVLDAEEGTTYRIAVASTSTIGDEGDFTIDIHAFVPPANDDFDNAQAIGPALPIAVGGTTVNATDQAGEPIHGPGVGSPPHSVWYRWTAATTEQVTIDACNATFPSAMAVYTGSQLGALTQEQQAQPFSCGFPTPGSRITLDAVAGETYSIAVDVLRPGRVGTFTLAIDGPSGAVPPSPPPPVPAGATATQFNLKKAIKRCRKKFKGKAQAKKRKRCISKARKRARLGG